MVNLLVILMACIAITPLLGKDIVQEIKDSQKERVDLLKKKEHLLEEAGSLEKKLQELNLKQRQMEESITLQRKEIQDKLPLMLRLGRTDPLRILVDGAASKDTIRGLILLRSLSRSLKQQYQRLHAASSENSALRQDIKLKQQNQNQLLQGLDFQHAQLEAFEASKFKVLAQSELDKLSGENDINDLLKDTDTALSKTKRKISKTTAEKDLPFRWLEKPVSGKIVKDKDLQKKFSPHAKGIIFETKKNADVYSPSDGTVVFKGPFKNQGDIIIIEIGDKVHTVLMGMHKISAETGQSVYAGQKVGKMAGYGTTSPKLYLELRQKGKAIDPKDYFIQRIGVVNEGKNFRSDSHCLVFIRGCGRNLPCNPFKRIGKSNGPLFRFF